MSLGPYKALTWCLAFLNFAVNCDKFCNKLYLLWKCNIESKSVIKISHEKEFKCRMFKKVEKEEVFSGLIIVRVLNLIDLFFKTRHVFKNKSIKFDKGSSTHGL